MNAEREPERELWSQVNPPGSAFRELQTESLYQVRKPTFMPPPAFPTKPAGTTALPGLTILPSISLSSLRTRAFSEKARPQLSLVPEPATVPRGTSRRVMIIEAVQLVRTVRRAGNEDGLTVAKLQSYAASLEHEVRAMRKEWKAQDKPVPVGPGLFTEGDD